MSSRKNFHFFVPFLTIDLHIELVLSTIDPSERKLNLDLKLYSSRLFTVSFQRHEAALRNLFIRVCSLLLVGVKPIFVFDGKPPALKARLHLSPVSWVLILNDVQCHFTNNNTYKIDIKSRYKSLQQNKTQ